MKNDNGPFLCGPRVPGPQDLAIVDAFQRRLEESWASANNPDGLCPCGHPWGIHDVNEYRGDQTEMCCVTGCAQDGCPGRRGPKQRLQDDDAIRRYEEAKAAGLSDYEAREDGWPTVTMCAGCLVKPIGHEGECYQ